MDVLSPKVLKNPLLTKLKEYNQKTIQQYAKAMISIPDYPVTLPDEWDGRVIWKKYLSKPVDQGECGSCWAYVSCSTLADRFAILTNNKVKVDLSPTNMILCNVYDFKQSSADDNILFQLDRIKKRACYGDTLLNAWAFLYILGVTTTNCTPYSYSKGLFNWDLKKFNYIQDLPLCHELGGITNDMCVDYSSNSYRGIEEGTPARFYRCMSFYTVPGTKKNGGSEELLRKEIWKWGPIATGMDVYADFYTFDPKKTIYRWNGEGTQISGHAIEIVGWGVEKNTPFWWVKNTWGKDWGFDGYFKMVRGENNCNIENNVVVGIPDLFLSYYNREVFFDEYLKKYYKNTRDFKLLQYELHVNEGAKLKSGQLKYLVAGGIEPTLGFTRRAIIHHPSISFKPLIKPKDLSNFNTFYAAKLNYSKNNLFKSLIENFSACTSCQNKPLSMTYILLCIVLIIILVIGIIIFK